MCGCGYFPANLQLWWVTFLICQDSAERNLERRKDDNEEEISDSIGKVSHVVIFFMYDTHVYHYCNDSHIHFNIKMHIGVMCDYDMYEIILYTIAMHCFTFI